MKRESTPGNDSGDKFSDDGDPASNSDKFVITPDYIQQSKYTIKISSFT